MKKKAVLILAAILVICVSITGLAACKDKKGSTKESGVEKIPTKLEDVYLMLAQSAQLTPSDKDAYNAALSFSAQVVADETPKHAAVNKTFDFNLKATVDKKSGQSAATYGNRLFLEIKSGSELLLGAYYVETDPSASRNVLYLDTPNPDGTRDRRGVNFYSLKRALSANSQTNSALLTPDMLFLMLFSGQEGDFGIADDKSTAFATMDISKFIKDFAGLFAGNRYGAYLDEILAAAGLDLSAADLKNINLPAIKARLDFKFSNGKLSSCECKLVVDKQIDIKINGKDAASPLLVEEYIPKTNAVIKISRMEVYSGDPVLSEADFLPLGLSQWRVGNALNVDATGSAALYGANASVAARELTYELKADIDPFAFADEGKTILTSTNFEKAGVFDFKLKEAGSVVLQIVYDPKASGDNAVYVYAKAKDVSDLGFKYGLSDLAAFAALKDNTPPPQTPDDAVKAILGAIKNYAARLGSVLGLCEIDSVGTAQIDLSKLEALIGGIIGSETFTGIFADAATLKITPETQNFGVVADYTAFDDIKTLYNFEKSVSAVKNVKRQYAVGETLQLTSEKDGTLFIADFDKIFFDAQAAGDSRGYVVAHETDFDPTKAGSYTVTLYVSGSTNAYAKTAAENGAPLGLIKITYSVTVA